MNYVVMGMKTYKKKDNKEKTKGLDNKWKVKFKHFLMPLLQNKVLEINCPNFIS